MLSYKLLPALMIGALTVVGCGQDRPDATTTTTQTETKEVGSTAESTTTTTTERPSGVTTSAVTSSYVGTVTAFELGKSIEVMTGTKELHVFALDGKSDMVEIDPVTAVGSKVILVEEMGDGESRKITVSIAPAA